MKTKLFFLAFLFSATLVAQIPNDAIKRYLFTNGSLTNDVSPGNSDLVPTGSSRINTMDPIGNINDAILVNSDKFDAGKRGTITNVDMAGNMSVSFWIKTNTNDSSERNMISQYGPAGFGPYGWNVILVNGKIRLKNKSLINGAVITPEISVESSVIADNQWHHIVCTVDKLQFFSGGWTFGPQVSLFVDKIFQNSAHTGGASSLALIYLNPSPNLTITIGGGTPNFTEAIDNIRFYNRALSTTEINSLFYEYSGTLSRFYVNSAATGANNGSSWLDAYTSLQTALNAANNQEIWIAQGVYKPHASDRNASFVIPVSINIFGGFIGNETQLSERNWRTNPTILSGDLSGNDDANITFTNTLRNDNSYHIIKANANNIVLDGLTLSDAHASGSSGADKSGAAITKDANVTNFTIKNCIFKNNVSLDAAACLLSPYTVGGTKSLAIENTEFKNNLATYATTFYLYTNTSTINTLNVNISNSLFDTNKAIDNGASLGYAGSAGWFRAYANGSTINTNFTNNTYVNNIDAGTNALTLNRATIGLEKRGTAIINSQINNCIFWNNQEIGGATAKAVNRIADTFSTATTTVNNSLDIDNFSTIITKQNIITANPSFISLSDFQLNSGSPAINTGNNTNVIGTVDLLGNQRIYNTTVDMGAYEFGSVLSSQSFNEFSNFNIYPNPSDSIINVSSTKSIDTMEIFSLDGRKIKSVTAKTIDISELSTGMYLLQVKTTEGKIGIKKIIKN
ncbi:MAG: LamG-like jellyroll fold domain-containing protein [Flavobacterium sp.]|uniref:LamG-like jellyroll fold domain-containing protein n=1 Tax=Flavobacterium sp. TaxID=239 RepID=UPI003262D226